MRMENDTTAHRSMPASAPSDAARVVLGLHLGESAAEDGYAVVPTPLHASLTDLCEEEDILRLRYGAPQRGVQDPVVSILFLGWGKAVGVVAVKR